MPYNFPTRDENQCVVGACAHCPLRFSEGIRMEHRFQEKPRVKIRCKAVQNGTVWARPIFVDNPEMCRRLKHYRVKQHSDEVYYDELMKKAGAHK